jgi:predicted nucleic acid-binding protein
MKVFLDTNILLDFLDDARASHSDAVNIVRHLIMNDIETYLSEDMLTTIYYISKNKTKALEFFETVLQIWKVVSFGKERVFEAIAISKEGKDFEDVLQCLSAKEYQCSLLITNDKGFYSCSIEVINSTQYLSSIEK